VKGLTLLFALSFPLIACKPGLDINQAQALFAAEVGCREDRVTSQDVGETGYLVKGCGYKQVYTCVTRRTMYGGGEDVCQPNGPRQENP
jgi:hypothetical protein